MSIQDLGAIGELIAAIATIATLLYLAFQIRQTNRIARSTVVSELQEKFINFYNVVLANDELAGLLASLKDPEFKPNTDVERTKIETLSILLTSIWFSAQESYDQGQIDQSTYDAYCEDVKARLRWWPALKPYLLEVYSHYPSAAGDKIAEPILGSET